MSSATNSGALRVKIVGYVWYRVFCLTIEDNYGTAWPHNLILVCAVAVWGVGFLPIHLISIWTHFEVFYILLLKETTGMNLMFSMEMFHGKWQPPFSLKIKKTYHILSFVVVLVNILSANYIFASSRRALCLIDLDCPSEKSHRINRQSKWDISCVQWNPHASHAHLFCTAVSLQVELVNPL